ncbi:MAG TPA: YraN family protein [Silvibacterium sp.]|nr:YraN family protein [Silvibacterium sp.]
MSRFEKLRLRLFENLVNALDRAAVRRSREAPHLVTGRRGERAAFFYLRRLGFIVTARAWRSARARGDLDLVAWEDSVLCFIEVKTRTTRAVAPAEAAVDTEKKRMLRKMAHYYLRQLKQRDVPVRFDILSIYFEPGRAADFELFRGAFGWE